MTDAVGNALPERQDERLSTALREVRNAAADRNDVVVDMREAQRTRLEMLAEDLKPVFEGVPDEMTGFDFALSSGEHPRLWIDAVAHVSMGRDRRSYRFLRETRYGRIVLAESSDIAPVSEQVTRYVAERVVEWEKARDGALEPLVERAVAEPAKVRGRGWREFVSGVALMLVGVVMGAAVTLALLRDSLPPLDQLF